MTPMTKVVRLSTHAARRARQRGVNDALIDLVLAHADIDDPAGSGCTLLRISRERLADLRPRIGARLADKLFRSHALDALDHPAPAAPPSGFTLARALDQIAAAQSNRFDAPGVGEAWRLTAPTIAGAALVHEGQCVHLAAFLDA